jgi:hypothetical protein
LFLSVTVVAALVVCASGDVIKVVSPSSAESVEGDLMVAPDSQPRRLQFLFPASDFSRLPDSHRLIVSWNFRADQAQTEPANLSFPHSQIWMSTTTRDALSEVYDNNHGPDKTLVHAGPLNFPLLGTGPQQGPRDFAAGMLLQNPFFYDPSQGSLLVEWANFGNSTPVPGPFRDLQTTSALTVLASEPGQVNSATGTLLNRLPVSQFAFDVAIAPSRIEVDTVTGMVTLVGGDANPVGITSYEISSTSGSLLPEQLVGFAAQDLDPVSAGLDGDDIAGNSPGESWDVLLADGTRIIEAFLLGSSVFDADRRVSLGRIYDTAFGDDPNLKFTYSIEAGRLVEGLVSFVQSQAIAGDFNDDGVVDAADYVVWRDGLGTIYAQSDYDEWRANFGQTGGRGLSMSRAVPEPDAWKWLALVAIGCGLQRRQSGQLPSKT